MIASCKEEGGDVSPHVPVLLDEVIHFLSPHPGGLYLDATLGAGGHTKAIFEKEPTAKVIGLDCDPLVIEIIKKDLTSQEEKSKNFKFTVVRGNFKDVEKIIAGFGEKIDGVIADLGLSSMQLSDGKRGFSFSSDAKLDMRMAGEGITAAEVVNTFPVDELEKIFKEYGDEHYAKRIARAIVNERRQKPFGSAKDLADFVAGCIGYGRDYFKKREGKRKIHPATRVFQALRIYVNNELENLKCFLESLPRIVSGGGRCVIISFHSGEDRIVKQAFNTFKREGLGMLLTPKPVFPSQEEIKRNPRSRSARLRAFEFAL